MKIATSFLVALLFTGTLDALNNSIAEGGILSQDQLTASSYCHVTSVNLPGQYFIDERLSDVESSVQTFAGKRCGSRVRGA
jgi:hypothetical protein